MKLFLSVMFIAVVALLSTVVSIRAQDPTGIIAVAGAILKPSGVNVATTRFLVPDDTWSMRVMVAFRYASQDIGHIRTSHVNVIPQGSLPVLRNADGRLVMNETTVDDFRVILEKNCAPVAMRKTRSLLVSYPTTAVIQRLTKDGYAIEISKDCEDCTIGYLPQYLAESARLSKYLPLSISAAVSVLDSLAGLPEGNEVCNDSHVRAFLDSMTKVRRDMFVEYDDEFQQYTLTHKEEETTRLRWSYALGYQHYLRTSPYTVNGLRIYATAGGPSLNGVLSMRLKPWLRAIGGISASALVSNSILAEIEDSLTTHRLAVSAATSFTMEGILGLTFSHPDAKEFALFVDVVAGYHALRNVRIPQDAIKNATTEEAAAKVPVTLFDRLNLGVQVGVSLSL